MNKNKGPKILFADIETAPIQSYVWGLWDQNVGLNQIKSDWHLLSWAAKWADSSKILYQDQRGKADVQDDRALLRSIWKLLDEADVVIWQNGKAFDHKKLNARFILAGMQPPSTYKQIDTLRLAKKHFGFTSNKLEYLSDKLCVKYKKQTKRKFAGFDMWLECLKGNKKAWKEMEKYNKYDVLALEELYTKLIPWDAAINFNLWSDDDDHTCTCGSKSFVRNGYFYSTAAKYQRYRCVKCGKETRSKSNLLSESRVQALRVGTAR